LRGCGSAAGQYQHDIAAEYGPFRSVDLTTEAFDKK